MNPILPKISIIMPVYNSGEYLKTAVDSILNQSLKEIELILVDDGSTDGSSERCDAYARQDNRVVVIHQKNGGICNARNAALKIARGEYIGFSDHDDEFETEAFEQAYKMAVDKNADLVKFRKDELIIRGDKIIRTKTSHFETQVMDRENIISHIFYLKDVYVLNCVWDGIFKKQLFENIKFDETYKSGGEDIAIMYDIIVKVNRLVLINKIFYHHYIRRGFSTSSKFNLNNIESKKRLVLHMNAMLTKINVNRDEYPLNYTLYLLKFVFFPVIAILSASECAYPIQKKKSIIQEMISADYTPTYFLKQSIWEISKNSRKIGLGYFLLKNSLYRLLFLMFSIRVKNS